MLFVFKQKTAYEMRISDWSSDVCSSDLFAFFVDDLYTVDAAIALVDELEVIHFSVGPWDAQWRERPRAVCQQGHELFVGSGGWHRYRSQRTGTGDHGRCVFYGWIHLDRKRVV